MSLPFEFVAGHPALDLVNTRMHRTQPGGADDLLETPEALRAWLEAAGLLDPVEAAPLDPELSLFSARRLRSALERIAFALLKRGEAADDLEAGLRALNALLEGGRERVQLERSGTGFVQRTHFEALSNHDPSLTLAREAARFLGTLEPRRLKVCEGEGCDLIFHDTTRNAARRWCSMDGCGNREKQARHRRRSAPTRSSA